MGVNGISGSTPNTTATSNYKNTSPKTAEKAETAKQDDAAVVYESSSKSKTTDKTTYKQDTATISKMKADSEARTAQLRSLVEKLITKQGDKFNEADMWTALREGKVKADPATVAQAQKDIAEDGYYGVEQTSERMLSFAMALTGGDPDKADERMEAFKKGFEAATKAWGDKLPDISQKTYDATIKKFEEWKNGGAVTAE